MKYTTPASLPVNFTGTEPQLAHEGDAAYDLVAAHDFFIEAGHRIVVDTDLSIQLPRWIVGLVCSRSGLAANKGVQVLNAPGVIDSNFTGSVKVILHNSSLVDYRGRKGDRIAQLLIFPHCTVSWKKVETLEETDRGNKGLGSSGV